MSYLIKGKNGQPVEFNGGQVRAMDLEIEKLEGLDEANLSFIAVASTEDPDRDNDIVRQAGWDMKFFKKNPVIPWSHNYYTPPIARSLKTWVDKNTNRLLFMPKFDASDDFAVKVFNKYRLGFLTSFSVGFRGIDYELRDEDDWWGGYEFTRQELFEISSVTVPANPHANVYLNSISENLIKSMADKGYSEYFSIDKQKDVMFYPIRDVYQYRGDDVRMAPMGKGVMAVLSVPIDDDHPESGYDDELKTVGYQFDTSEFDNELANDWIKQNAEQTWTSDYFYVKFDEESKVYTVESKPKTMDIKLYDAPVELDEEKTPSNARRYVGLDEDIVFDLPDDELDNKDSDGLEDKDLDDGGDTDDVTDETDPLEIKDVIEITNRIESSLNEFYSKFWETYDQFEEKMQELIGKSVPTMVDEIIKLISKNDVVRQALLATHDDSCDNNKTDDSSSDNSDTNSDDEGTIELDESLMTSDDVDNDDPDTIELDFDTDEGDGNQQAETVRATITGALKSTLDKAVKDILDNSRSLD